nr:hypothetical protein [Sphingomonas sp. Y57]
MVVLDPWREAVFRGRVVAEMIVATVRSAPQPNHRHAAILGTIPIQIVDGRSDQICPPTQALCLVDELRKAGVELETFLALLWQIFDFEDSLFSGSVIHGEPACGGWRWTTTGAKTWRSG